MVTAWPTESALVISLWASIVVSCLCCSRNHTVMGNQLVTFDATSYCWLCYMPLVVPRELLLQLTATIAIVFILLLHKVLMTANGIPAATNGNYTWMLLLLAVDFFIAVVCSFYSACCCSSFSHLLFYCCFFSWYHLLFWLAADSCSKQLLPVCCLLLFSA